MKNLKKNIFPIKCNINCQVKRTLMYMKKCSFGFSGRGTKINGGQKEHDMDIHC